MSHVNVYALGGEVARLCHACAYQEASRGELGDRLATGGPGLTCDHCLHHNPEDPANSTNNATADRP